MHRVKVDPGVSELPRGNELSRDHVNRPLVCVHAVSYTADEYSVYHFCIIIKDFFISFFMSDYCPRL